MSEMPMTHNATKRQMRSGREGASAELSDTRRSDEAWGSPEWAMAARETFRRSGMAGDALIHLG